LALVYFCNLLYFTNAYDFWHR